MITEDYVSYEVAKLLKEKGFDVYGDGSFSSGIEIFAEYSPSGTLNKCITSKPHRKAYPAPTLQMAMKWLRAIHKIDISITPDRKENYTALVFVDRKLPFTSIGSFQTYEEACEAAIKYCLINLI